MGRERKEEGGGMRIGRREEAIVKEDAGVGGRHSVHGRYAVGAYPLSAVLVLELVS